MRLYDLLDKEQLAKLHDWMETQDKKSLALQGEKPKGSFIHSGASGGIYTYSFTPTTLGMVVKVANNLTHDEIDLSDYENW